MLPIIFRGHEEAGFFAHAVGLRAGISPLTVLPGNQRTSDARYACLIVVKDYVCLSSTCRAADAWHYNHLEQEILFDVREGRAILVFDLSNEGPAYDASLFDPLYAWIEHNRLPAGRCIWLGQNRLMGAAASTHAGARAGWVCFEHYDYFVKLMAWRAAHTEAFATNNSSSIDGAQQLLDVVRKDKLLLCLNATPRLSRILTVAALHHHLILHRSLVSFPGLTYVKAGASLSDALAFLDRHPRLESLRPWVHAVSHMAALKVDDFSEQGNALVEKIDRRSYERTFFSLVTESDFAERGIARVTEKTIKAFCLGHPALVIGNPHSVELACSFGFQDWTNVLNRAAEHQKDPAIRFESVLAEMTRQVQRIRADPHGWIAAVREVSVHNYHYASSGAFLAQYVKTYDDALITRMSRLIAV